MADEEARVIRAVSAILGLAERIWEHVRTVKPQTTSLKIRCPERVAEYAFAFNPNTLRKRIVPKLKLEIPTITSLEVVSLSSLKRVTGVVEKTPDGYVLRLDKLPRSPKGFLATADFLVQDPGSIGLLVETNSKADRVGVGDVDEYWLHAQLKYPKALKWAYSEVEVKDLDVGVDVGVYEALRIVLPERIPRTMEALRNLIREKDPHQLWKRAMEYSRVARGSEAEYVEKLQEVRRIILSDEFRTYVDVERDFRYLQTVPSLHPTDSEGFLGVPRFAHVLARANLDLEAPAAEGVLVYKSGEFQKKTLEIFGRRRT